MYRKRPGPARRPRIWIEKVQGLPSAGPVFLAAGLAAGLQMCIRDRLNGMAVGAGGAVGGAINLVPKHAEDKPLTLSLIHI